MKGEDGEQGIDISNKEVNDKQASINSPSDFGLFGC